MTKTRLENIIRLVTILATLFLVIMTVLAISLYAKAGVLASKNASLDKQIENLSITRAELEQGIAIRKSDAYIEQQARENLGMIRDNETLYIFD